MLEFDVGTVIFQLVNFAILLVALYFLLFRPAMRNVSARKAEKKRQAHEMAQSHAEMEQLRAELEERLARAEEEADTIVRRAQEQAQAERETLMQDAQAEVERILVEAHTDASRLRQQAADDFHDELLDTIMELCAWAIARTAPDQVHDTMVQELCDRIWEMGRTEMDRVETFRRSLGDRVPTAYVTSARPLSPEQQGLLARTLTALADQRVNLDLRTDTALAAGLRVRMGDTLVDHSIGGQLAELRQSVSQALLERLSGEPAG